MNYSNYYSSCICYQEKTKNKHKPEFNKDRKFALALILGFVAFISLTSCSKPLPAEQQLLNTINDARIAAESLSARKLEDFLAPDFSANNKGKNQKQLGQHDFQWVKRTMLGLSLRKQKINIIFSANTVTLDQHNTQLAKINTTALITGGRGLLPEDGKIYQIESHWRLYGKDWKVTSFTWE